MKKIKTPCTLEENKLCVIPYIFPMQLNINTSFCSLFRIFVGSIYYIPMSSFKVDANNR